MKKLLQTVFITVLVISIIAETVPASLVAANPVPPWTEIKINSIQENREYPQNNIFLDFSLSTVGGTFSYFASTTPIVAVYLDGWLIRSFYLNDLNGTVVSEVLRDFSVNITGIKPGLHRVWVNETATYNLLLTMYTATATSGVTTFTVYVPETTVSVTSPIQSATYTTKNVPLNFSTQKPASSYWISLDGEKQILIYRNTTLSDLTYGVHSVEVFAVENQKADISQKITFTITPPKTSSLPQLTIVLSVAGIVIAVVVATSLLLYRKRRH